MNVVLYNILPFLRQALMDSVKISLSLGSEMLLTSNSFFISSSMKQHGNDPPRPREADFIPLFQAASLSSAHLRTLTANTSCGLWKGYIKIIIIYYSHSAKSSCWNHCSEERRSPGLLQTPLCQQEDSHQLQGASLPAKSHL